MEELSLKSVFSRNSEIITADMDGDTVMMSAETGKYYNLGKMGSVIWKMIEFPLSGEELVNRLMDVYNVSCDQCKTDISPFLSELINNHILIEKKI